MTGKCPGCGAIEGTRHEFGCPELRPDPSANQIHRRPEPREPQMMQGIVIGGVADGVIIPSMRADATFIELGRPTHLKPLAYAKQPAPEVAKETDVYQVCTLYIDAGGPAPIPFGIVILEGTTVVHAFSELVKGFAENVQTKMTAELLQQ